MPKNKGKGGKNFRKGKNDTDETTRELLFKQDGQEYAQMNKMLGGGIIEAYCYDGQTRRCHLRGNINKKIWLNVGDIILVNVRDYQGNTADVIHKYLNNEVKNLKIYGEIPNVESDVKEDNTNEVIFEYSDTES